MFGVFEKFFAPQERNGATKKRPEKDLRGGEWYGGGFEPAIGLDPRATRCSTPSGWKAYVDAGHSSMRQLAGGGIGLVRHRKGYSRQVAPPSRRYPMQAPGVSEVSSDERSQGHDTRRELPQSTMGRSVKDVLGAMQQGSAYWVRARRDPRTAARALSAWLLTSLGAGNGGAAHAHSRGRALVRTRAGEGSGPLILAGVCVWVSTRKGVKRCSRLGEGQATTVSPWRSSWTGGGSVPRRKLSTATVRCVRRLVWPTPGRGSCAARCWWRWGSPRGRKEISIHHGRGESRRVEAF